MGGNKKKVRALKIRFLSPATIELDEAIKYYEHQLPGLGIRFFQEINASIERISFTPKAWVKIGERTHRCLIKNFPYALLYIVDKHEEIIITQQFPIAM